MFLTSTARSDNCPELLNFQATRLHSTESLNFCQAFSGKLLLVVNTASQCGYTPQLNGLETLYQKYKDRGLVIVGFPSNDFHQEFADEEKTAKVCYLNYGVSFPMFSKISVKWKDRHPLYEFLSNKEKNGSISDAPGWNFCKYLVDENGKVLKYFPSSVNPMDKEITDLL